MVSSCRQTQRRTSSRPRLQSSPKRSTVAETTISSFERGRGMGRSYCPKARRARWPTIDPAAMPSRTGFSSCSSGPSMAGMPSSSSAGRSSPGRRRLGAERAGEPLEERTVGVEGALRPGGLGDRQDVHGPPVDGGVETGGVLHVQLGDARRGRPTGSGRRGRCWPATGPRWPPSARTGGPRPSAPDPAPAASWRTRRRRGCPGTDRHRVDRSRSLGHHRVVSAGSTVPRPGGTGGLGPASRRPADRDLELAALAHGRHGRRGMATTHPRPT